MAVTLWEQTAFERVLSHTLTNTNTQGNVNRTVVVSPATWPLSPRAESLTCSRFDCETCAD